MKLLIKIAVSLVLIITPFAFYGQTLHVLTYNVHHCNPPDKPGVIDVDEIARVIKESKADLVAVQEVDVYTQRSGGIHQAALIAEKAEYPYYYFGKAIDYNGGDYGVLILSKYPLSDTSTLFLPQSQSPKNEQRVLAVATVHLPNGKVVRFASTHLEAFDEESRTMQAKELVKIAKESKHPFVIAGDFNDFPDSHVMKLISGDFGLSCTDCPTTFTDYGERGAIDYISFYPRTAFTIQSHEVIPEEKASDHLPVRATLILQY